MKSIVFSTMCARTKEDVLASLEVESNICKCQAVRRVNSGVSPTRCTESSVPVLPLSGRRKIRRKNNAREQKKENLNCSGGLVPNSNQKEENSK